MSTSINALYVLENKGSTYLYFPRYHEAELATNILHEVVIKGPTGKMSRTDVDYTHNRLLSRASFLKWIQSGMPDREEYARVFLEEEQAETALVPLNSDMIDDLFKFYKN